MLSVHRYCQLKKLLHNTRKESDLVSPKSIRPARPAMIGRDRESGPPSLEWPKLSKADVPSKGFLTLCAYITVKTSVYMVFAVLMPISMKPVATQKSLKVVGVGPGLKSS